MGSVQYNITVKRVVYEVRGLPVDVAMLSNTPKAEIATMSSKLAAAMTMVGIPLALP
jgi:hypothetical protein